MTDRVVVGETDNGGSSGGAPNLTVDLNAPVELPGALARADALQAQAILEYIEGRPAAAVRSTIPQVAQAPRTAPRRPRCRTRTGARRP